MLDRYLDRLQRRLGRWAGATEFCRRLRNQCNNVIGAYLGESAHPYDNGEFAVLELLAPKCSLFVDVGANVGQWSAKFLELGQACGIAYEPSSSSFEQLCVRVRRDRMTFRNVAVGDAVGQVTFVEKARCGEESAVRTASGPVEPGDTVKTVDVTTLDHDLMSGGKVVDYLKIDTEGYDLNVLRGARGLLAAGRIRFIQFEYGDGWLGAGSSLKAANTFLAQFGFTAYLIRSTGLHPFRYERWGDYFRYSNFLACQERDLAVLKPLLGDSI